MELKLVAAEAANITFEGVVAAVGKGPFKNIKLAPSSS